MNNEEWHWQKPGTWKGIGIYHVTMVVSRREALLGNLVIPDDNPAKARVDLSLLGFQIKACVDDIPIRYPEIRIIQLRMMPDHLHVILYVTKPMSISIKMVVRGLWQGAKKVGPEKFTELPFIRPMSHRGQLQTMIHYLQMNPQRLATKKLKNGYSDGLFDAVAAGKVLIISPWEYNPKKGHVTREECVAMNMMAEQICESLTKTATSISSK